MLKVTVELIPHEKEDEKETISEIFIANSLKHSPLGGDGYLYEYYGWMKSGYREIKIGYLV